VIIPINYILLIFHERAVIVRLTFTVKTTRVRNMADFVKPIHRHKASVLEGHGLLFVHCISSEPMLLVPMGYRVFSFNAVRFTSEEPLYLSLNVDEIFADCNSPALIEYRDTSQLCFNFRVSRLF
jgi:hypothetical protein